MGRFFCGRAWPIALWPSKAMYVLDTDKHHHPPIHVRYNDFKAVLKIPDGELLKGGIAKAADEAGSGLDRTASG